MPQVERATEFNRALIELLPRVQRGVPAGD